MSKTRTRRPETTLATRFRLSLTWETELDAEPPPLTSAPKVVRFLWQNFFRDEPREVGVLLFANIHNQGIGHLIHSIGASNRLMIDMRLLLSAALLANATGIIFAHNHPSGSTKAGPEDVEFMVQLARGSRAVGLHVIDYLIVASARRWYSFREPLNELERLQPRRQD
ncbi:MAG: JAB domain-containing protein [Thermoanaerobaculia bacterium]